MINIWDWAYADRVEIVTENGEAYRGNVIDIGTAEEEGLPEDEITLETKTGAIYGFMPSMIQSIQHYS